MFQIPGSYQSYHLKMIFFPSQPTNQANQQTTQPASIISCINQDQPTNQPTNQRHLISSTSFMNISTTSDQLKGSF